MAPFIVRRAPSGAPAALAETLRAAARSFDATLALYDIRTMEAIRAESVAERRFLLLLIGAFGVLALVLAAVGVYGVMALVWVLEPDAGDGRCRLALGAAPAEVLGMVARQAVILAAIGVAAGIAVATALTPLMALTQLFGRQPLIHRDERVVLLILVVIATIAALVPGRLAMRIDPVRAMNAG